MKIILLTILLGLFEIPQFELENGDLIFQEDCSGSTDNTIKEVTSSIGDYRFTHVGIVYIDENGETYVIEATRPKVTMTSLKDYLYPDDKESCYQRSVVGRLKAEHRHLIPKAIEEAHLLVGKEYDDGFIPGNDKYYCSELIYEIFKTANNGNDLFPLNIMTFRSPATGEITDGWKAYFRKYDLPVPEGELGINPGIMSQSGLINIVHYYD